MRLEKGKKIFDEVKKRKIHTLIILGVSFIVAFLTYKSQQNIETTIKFGVFCVLLSAIAYVDYKKKIIPNFMIVALAIFVILLNVWKFNMGYTLSTMTSFLVIGVLTLVLHIISKNSIGMGDVKLLAVTSALLGIHYMFSILFITLILSSILGIVLLTIFKKEKNQTIAFAPVLLVGFLVSVIFNLI